MTHRGPFQPLPFCDSVILCQLVRAWAKPKTRQCWGAARAKAGGVLQERGRFGGPAQKSFESQFYQLACSGSSLLFKLLIVSGLQLLF